MWIYCIALASSMSAEDAARATQAQLHFMASQPDIAAAGNDGITVDGDDERAGPEGSLLLEVFDEQF